MHPCRPPQRTLSKQTCADFPSKKHAWLQKEDSNAVLGRFSSPTLLSAFAAQSTTFRFLNPDRNVFLIETCKRKQATPQTGTTRRRPSAWVIRPWKIHCSRFRMPRSFFCGAKLSGGPRLRNGWGIVPLSGKPRTQNVGTVNILAPIQTEESKESSSQFRTVYVLYME